LLRSNPDVVVGKMDPIGNQSVLRLNWLHPPFNNVKARQAFQWITDQKDFMMAAYGNRDWIECPAFFGCGTPNETDIGSVALMNVDMEKARQLLKESGYKGEPIVILDPTDRAHLHADALVAAQKLREIGAKVDVQAVDWSTLVERRASKKAPAEGGWNIFASNSLIGGLMDPVSSIHVSAGCDKAWYGWPCDEKIEKFRMDWARAVDPAEKKKIVEEIQKRAHDIVVYVPLGQYVGVTAHRKELNGLIKSPVPFYWNVSKGN
jgi:peptide/nickel transport system substrate-binding protein